jgi:hypothetical protein
MIHFRASKVTQNAYERFMLLYPFRSLFFLIGLP